MAYSVTAPNEKAFGAEQDAYLKSLASTTGDPAADAVNRLNLGFQASGNDPNEYKNLYLQYLANQNAGSGLEEHGKIAAAAIAAAGANAKAGVSGAYLPAAGNPLIRVDPTRLNQADATNLQSTYLGGVKDAGAGLKDLAEAGVRPDLSTISGMLTPSVQRTPSPVSNYLSSKDKAALEQAAAAKVAADAATYRAVHNHEGANAAKDVTTFIIDPKTGIKTPISVTSTTKPGASTPELTPQSTGHWERDPKTNQSKFVPDAKK